MLELLVKYARDHDLEAEPGFKPKYVRWLVVCDDGGPFSDVLERGDTEAKKNPGQLSPKCPDLSQPELVSGSETRSHFMVDTIEVVALFGKGSADPKVQEKHRYFVKLLQDASGVVPQLAPVARLLENEQSLVDIRNRLEALKAKPNDKITFKVGNSTLLDSDAWHDWWRAFREGLSSARAAKKSKEDQGEATRPMRCYATGSLAVPVATHLKIEGLADVGGQPSGTALVGFDKDSFCSYGLSQSANAAMSEEAVTAYRAALNDLIRNYGQRLAGAKVVHWFQKSVPAEDDPLSWLEVGEEHQQRSAQQRAKELLEGIRTGKRVDLLGNYFYAVTLSGSGGRVMVRDWMEGQFEDLAGNISRWFDDLSIVRRDGQGLAPTPKFLAVLGATVRDLRDLPPPFVARMWRVAVRDEQIPYHALAEALDRAKADVTQDEPPNHAGMGLLKAYHTRMERTKGGKEVSQGLTPYLNEGHTHPAYHCGRLMAVLAEIQRSALGDVGAGIVQRYYAAASSTPALVLGRLTRTSQFHLGKLSAGLAYWYEGKVAGIWGRIKDDVPATLTLEEQSLFALGFYQQLANMRAGKPTKSNEKKEATNE